MWTLAVAAATAPAAAVLAAAAAAVWLRRRFVLVTVRGSSMQPTFRSGDRVLVRRMPLSAIRPGAVVVVEPPVPALPRELARRAGAGPNGLDRLWMIKRAAAVPGSPVPESLAVALGAGPGDLVPPGRLAVLGDNGQESYDSRFCGYLGEAQLLGVAVRSVGRVTEQPSPAWPMPVPDDLEGDGE